MHKEQPILAQVHHNHHVCLQLAGDASLAQVSAQMKTKPTNILLYARLSEDLDDMLRVLQECVVHITNNYSSESSRTQFIYMERWALDALQKYMKETGQNILREVEQPDDKRTMETPNATVVLKEWLPEGEQGENQLAVIEPETQELRPQLKEHEKEHIDFDYVYCIGGDGTLLRLLRILFFRFLPPTLPKIVTLSMGSLGYLCNFEISELNSILDNTALANSQRPVDSKIKIDYRARLSCQLEDLETALPVTGNRTFYVSQGGKEVQPAVCHALNEISITRGNAEFMCRLDIYINDTLLTIVQGDGLLISTPTGSTAYNLSCGGSIAHPATEVICLTPICPHSLAFRPLILPKSAKISIVLPEEARAGAWVTFDG